MTDKPTPTDAELEALLLTKLPASKHYIRPIIEKMVAAMQAAIDKWGHPAQAASSAVLKAIRWANMQLVRTSDDAFMLVPYKAVTAQAAKQQEQLI